MTAHVRLVDRKLRIVELYAPKSPASRDATDRALLVDTFTSGGPVCATPVGHCYQSHGRTARFIVDTTGDGDRLLAHLSRLGPAFLADVDPYTSKGWRVRV